MKLEIKTMKQTSEETNRAAIWKSLVTFLEGSTSLNRIVDEIESSGVRGGDLARILEGLRGHGNSGLHDAISAICLKRGWIGSFGESIPPGPPTNPPLALIIEDHDDSAVLFANAMQGAGFEIEIIRTGDAAVARLSETTPAVVILDLHLPRVSGMEILHRIRADARLVGVYVIVATAYPDMVANLGGEADQAFLKPVSYVQLHDLALHLNLKYARRANHPPLSTSD
jgi:CheY-like chemotaxis protein